MSAVAKSRFSVFSTIMFFAVTALLSPAPSSATSYSYSFVGSTDTGCQVQAAGGIANCSVSGSFDLHSEYFGIAQHALNAEFSLFVNGTLFDNAYFPPYSAPDPLFDCIEYCNQVITDASGIPISVDLHRRPPASLDDAIFLSINGWSWDILENGNGLFAFARGVTITNLGITPVPVPAPLALFLTGLVGLGIIGRRRNRSANS